MVYYSLPCYNKKNTLFSAVPTVRTTQFIIVHGNPLFSLYNNIPKRILTASKLSIFHNGSRYTVCAYINITAVRVQRPRIYTTPKKIQN